MWQLCTCECGGLFSECIKQFVFSFKRVYIDGLNIGDEGFSRVSSKGNRASCLEVKKSKVKKQHKRFASLQRRETFQHSHFVVPDETNRIGKAWEEWLEGIEREFRYFRITEAVDKKDAIIIYGGKEIARQEKSLPDQETADVYLKLRTKLNDHFTPKKNKHHARYLFLKWGHMLVKPRVHTRRDSVRKPRNANLEPHLTRESWST